MDVMDLRRRLMMAMARGAEVVKGTFTVPDGSGNYTLSFGKTFGKYVYIIEMTGESKQQLMQSGQDANKGYARLGIYPTIDIDGLSPSNTSHMSMRVNTVTQDILATVATGIGIDGSSITIAKGAVSGASANVLYNGCSYNYTIISLDNV